MSLALIPTFSYRIQCQNTYLCISGAFQLSLQMEIARLVFPSHMKLFAAETASTCILTQASQSITANTKLFPTDFLLNRSFAECFLFHRVMLCCTALVVSHHLQEEMSVPGEGKKQNKNPLLVSSVRCKTSFQNI